MWHLNQTKMKFFLIVVLVVLTFCGKKTSTKEEIHTIAEDRIKVILEDWRIDSLGCLGKRHKPDSVKMALNQLGLNGKESSLVLTYLGQPNFFYNRGDTSTFVYFLECGEKGKVSYSNFYCHFVNDTVWYFSQAIF